MRLQEIEQEALALSDGDRAALAVVLLETLGTPETEITDDEALRRDAEMESGEVPALSQEEFVRSVQQERRK
jgi:hypothetical protein